MAASDVHVAVAVKVHDHDHDHDHDHVIDDVDLDVVVDGDGDGDVSDRHRAQRVWSRSVVDGRERRARPRCRLETVGALAVNPGSTATMSKPSTLPAAHLSSTPSHARKRRSPDHVIYNPLRSRSQPIQDLIYVDNPGVYRLD